MFKQIKSSFSYLELFKITCIAFFCNVLLPRNYKTNSK